MGVIGDALRSRLPGRADWSGRQLRAGLGLSSLPAPGRPQCQPRDVSTGDMEEPWAIWS